MSEFLVVLNGELTNHEPLRQYLQNVSTVIAADGGVRHLDQLGVSPHVIIGDFDSADAHRVDSFRKQGVEIISYPRAKDATDGELALLLAAQRGATLVHLVGIEAGRSDHLLGIMMMLSHQALTSVRMWAHDAEHRTTIIHEGVELGVDCPVGARLSLIPLTPAIKGVTLTGVHWQLEDAQLFRGESKGISNVITAPRVAISIRSGSALIMVGHHPV